MTVRFKCQSEYQKSYGSARSRSVSPQRCVPSAGLRSDLMGTGREPGLQRRKRTGPLARSCSSLLFPPDDPAVPAHRRAPPAASRSRSAHRKAPPQNQKPPPETPGPAADPEPPERPDPEPLERPDPEPPKRPDPEPRERSEADGKSVKLRPSEPVSQSQPSRAATGAAPAEQRPSDDQVRDLKPVHVTGQDSSTFSSCPVLQVDQVLRWRAGLRSGGHRSGVHRSEYHRQFSWKKPVTSSPLLTAEQVLNSSRPVPPFRTNPVAVETEYRRNFRGLVPPTRPRLRKHLEHERVPLFHTQSIHKEKRAESHKHHPKQEVPRRENSPLKDTPPPLQVQKKRRMLSEYQSSFRSRLHRNPEGGGATDAVTQQVEELRRQAQSYRHRAWGTNFCRDHLSQLLSDHNVLWEPTAAAAADSPAETPTQRLTPDPSPEPDGRSAFCVEALDLASNSSRKSSSERRSAWGGEEETTDEDEGRLPTPRLKTRPVQRTHHDLTTPAAGGAILVGKLHNADKQQKCGTAVTTTTGAEPAANATARHKEAWPEVVPGLSPEHKPASSPTFEPTRTKQASPSPVAPPPLISPPQHGIQGAMRHPDFQHNGELGLRFREPPCSGGGCASDEDDRLSVMSWRSAASCSAASAILERARKRRDNFWGKR
ncbi:nuclear protein MDM1 isoform X3 [Kryptolebias marmoratus]|uniref:nuclear protein MDM1 isoform X3 n=1 Tax=Kryptolebias marmoratus TaxID=37003 RepID=UPI0007F90793|nr:nuclear protein MDM1 isoform X3 [Kryptolebias marmoratus]